MSFTTTKPGFWRRRLTVTMALTLAIVIAMPWLVLNFVASIAHGRYAEQLTYPWVLIVTAAFDIAWAKGGPDLFRWIGTPPNALFYDLTYGSGQWISRAMYGFAIAPFVFLLGGDPFDTFRPDTVGVHGSARFADDGETKPFRKPSNGALIVGSADGTLKPKRSYYYDGNRHLLSLAPTRSGKGTCLIVPNLLTADRSVLVIDPKGENARITARQRATFGPVHVLDPFGVSGMPGACYNPLAGLNPDSADFADDAASLAAALILIDPGTRDRHFEEGARALLRGLIMFVAAEEPEDRRTLVTLREYLAWPHDKFEGLLALMAETETANGAIQRAANVFLAKNEKEARTILSSAQEQTTFLDSPHLARTLKSSNVSFADLKRGKTTIYLVLPQSRFESHGRWLRLLVARACQDIERTPRPAVPAKTRMATKTSGASSEPPILFLLDEFAAIGDMPAIKTAVGLMAGYDLQIWAFLQNWGQLEELYGKGAHTFAANAGVFHAFNINDTLTARYVSELSGDTTYSPALYNADAKGNGGVMPTGRKLITPEEAMHRLTDADLFLKYAGTSPIIAKKAPYFDDKRMMAMADG